MSDIEVFRDQKGRVRPGHTLPGGGRKKLPDEVKEIRLAAVLEAAKALQLYHKTDKDLDEYRHLNRLTQLEQITLQKIVERDLVWFKELMDRTVGKAIISADIRYESTKVSIDLNVLTDEELERLEDYARKAIPSD